MKELFRLSTLTLLLAMSTGVHAQGLFGKLKDKAVNAAKNAVERQLGNSVEAETSESESTEAVAEDSPEAATSTDFKRGSVIMFQDDVTAEQVGEFPSKWDLLGGAAEVKTLGGVKAIEVTENGVITPLLKQEGAYLPEEFTIEYDFYYWKDGSQVKDNDGIGLNDMKLILANTTDRSEYPGESGDYTSFALRHGVCESYEHGYYYNGDRAGSFEHPFKQGWHHVALSFNKRALKVYFDGKRVVNLPNVKQPTWFCFQVPFEYHNLTFIRNVVLAKGAVALYDRNAQDITAVEKAIQETGKFVTNNILFETGKATLKPESMTEIQKVADYMKKNPSVRFEVQGHTDNQGSDAVNDPLSQKRAEAVVKALADLGVDDFNLKPVGKGSHEPVADNNTDAGRAKNRRVEFIKR